MDGRRRVRSTTNAGSVWRMKAEGAPGATVRHTAPAAPNANTHTASYDSPRCGFVKRVPAALVLVVVFAVVLAAVLAPATALAATASEPMYRLYNRWSGEHLFTTDAKEYADLANIGWNQEGVAWQAPTEGDAVYRLYNQWSGDHFYTGDKAEYDSLGDLGWNKEGVAFHSDTSRGVPIYRLFNPWLTAGTHLFTTSEKEYNELQAPGWKGEGIAFYGVKETTPTPTPDPKPDDPSTKTHHVRFVTNEAGEERVLKEADVPDGAETFAPTTPSRDDYEFRGWNTEDDGSGTAWVSGTTATADVTYYAVWAPVAPAQKTEDGVTTKDASYADGVVAVDGEATNDEGTEATVPADEAKGVEPGDIVVINKDDPLNVTAIKVTSVTTGEDGQAKVEGEVPSIDEVYDDLEISGEGQITDDNFVPGTGITMSDVSAPAGTLSTQDVSFYKQFKIDFGEVNKKQTEEVEKFTKFFGDTQKERHDSTFSATGSYEITINASASYTGSVNNGLGVQFTIDRTDVLDSTIKGTGKIHLGYWEPVPCVAVDVDLVFDATGNVSLVTEATDKFGFSVTWKNVNYTHEHDGSSELDLDVDGKAGMSLYTAAKVGNMDMLGVEGNVGVHANAKANLRSSGLNCVDLKENLYLDFNFNTDVKFLKKLLDATGTPTSVTVWDESTSPWQLAVHLENGKKVQKCTYNTTPTGKLTVRAGAQLYTWDELYQISMEIAESGSEENALELAKHYNLTTEDGKLDYSQSKTFKLKDGTQCIAVIAGFYHDDVEIMDDELPWTKSKSGITWVLYNALPSHVYNASRDNSGGWEGSSLREYMNGDLLDQFPDDLKKLILPAIKSTNNVGYTTSTLCVTTIYDKLWALSCTELGGLSNAKEPSLKQKILDLEGSQYQLFSDAGINGQVGAFRVAPKIGGGGDTWWLRSPESDTSGDAYAYMSSSSNLGWSCSNKNHVVAGFCFGWDQAGALKKAWEALTKPVG